MGRAGKGKQAEERPKDDDDALLDAAIAENKATQKMKAQQPPEQKERGKEPAAAPGKAALTKQEIIEKLNKVPTFCLLNGETNIVGLQDPENPKFEVCFWMTDALEAKEMLAAALENNPEEVPSHAAARLAPPPSVPAMLLARRSTLARCSSAAARPAPLARPMRCYCSPSAVPLACRRCRTGCTSA
jgi:hypothetical protein